MLLRTEQKNNPYRALKMEVLIVLFVLIIPARQRKTDLVTVSLSCHLHQIGHYVTVGNAKSKGQVQADLNGELPPFINSKQPTLSTTKPHANP